MLRTDYTCWAECRPLSPRETWCWVLLGFLIWPRTPWFCHWLLTLCHFGTNQGPSLLQPWFSWWLHSFFLEWLGISLGTTKSYFIPLLSYPSSGLALDWQSCDVIYPPIKMFLIPFCKLLILFPTPSTKVSELIWHLMLGVSGSIPFLIRSYGNKKWTVCPIPSLMGLAVALTSSLPFR